MNFILILEFPHPPPNIKNHPKPVTLLVLSILHVNTQSIDTKPKWNLNDFYYSLSPGRRKSQEQRKMQMYSKKILVFTSCSYRKFRRFGWPFSLNLWLFGSVSEFWGHQGCTTACSGSLPLFEVSYVVYTYMYVCRYVYQAPDQNRLKKKTIFTLKIVIN